MATLSATAAITSAVKETVAVDQQVTLYAPTVALAQYHEHRLLQTNLALPIESGDGVILPHLRKVLERRSILPNTNMSCGARNLLAEYDVRRWVSRQHFDRLIQRHLVRRHHILAIAPTPSLMRSLWTTVIYQYPGVFVVNVTLFVPYCPSLVAGSTNFMSSHQNLEDAPSKVVRKITEDHVDFAMKQRLVWRISVQKEYERKQNDAAAEADVLRTAVERARSLNAGVAQVYLIWHELHDFTLKKVRQEEHNGVKLDDSIAFHAAFILGPGGVGKSFLTESQATEWIVNVPDAKEPNDRNSQVTINAHFAICSTTNQGAVEHGNAMVEHRDARMRALGSKVSSKHTTHEYDASVSLDKCLALIRKNRMKQMIMVDECFLVTGTYTDFFCIAREMTLLDSSLMTDVKSDAQLLRLLLVGDGDQISAFNGRWRGSDPLKTHEAALAEEEEDIIREEQQRYGSVGSNVMASTSGEVKEMKYSRFSDDDRWFLDKCYENCPVFVGTYFQRFDEDLYDRYLDKVYPGKQQYQFKYPGKQIEKINVLDAMCIVDMPEEDKKLLRPAFFTPDTQALLRQMKQRKKGEAPACSDSGTHHQIQGTSKSFLVCATQTNFAITQAKPPRGQNECES